jgi:SET domain-containing protein
MKAKLFQNKICVKPSPLGGYGVFAENFIDKDEIVEECYMLYLNEKPIDLSNYLFTGDSNYLFPLGFGCIYNHSPQPNVRYEYSLHKQILVFKAMRPIHKNEEILTTYGADWFSSRLVAEKQFSKFYRTIAFYKPMLLKASLVISVYCLILLSAHITVS